LILLHLAKEPVSFRVGELEMKPVFVTISPHLSHILYFISSTYLISKRLKIERTLMANPIRKELERKRTNLSDQDLNQLEAELNELSNIIIGYYLSERKKRHS